jgi:hypothetical protein
MTPFFLVGLDREDGKPNPKRSSGLDEKNVFVPEYRSSIFPALPVTAN